QRQPGAQQQQQQRQKQQPPGQQEQQQRGGLQSMIQGQARSAGRVLFPMISSTFEAIAGVLIIIFIAIYIAVSPRTYEKGILHLVPHPKRPRARELMTEVGQTLRGWLVARLLAMLIIGAITGIGLALLGIEAAIALAFIAGLLELIPFYGPIVAAIPAIGVGLVESPQKAISVAILYLIIQQLEGNVLTPLLLKKRLEVPPVLTIVVVSALGIVFGVVGMLAAEPLVAAGLVVTRKLYVRDVIGDDVD
ncbi:MAG TPA: AI-2E family transporter, partial [Thermoanaerobaculia bacterium]